MKDKKLIIMASVAGVLLVLGALFIMLAQRSLNNGTDMKGLDYVFIGLGTVFSISAFATILVIAVKILKEKKVI